MERNQIKWDECSKYLNEYLSSGFADVSLINKCETESEKKYCISFLYEKYERAGIAPDESINELERFLNELN